MSIEEDTGSVVSLPESLRGKERLRAVVGCLPVDRWQTDALERGIARMTDETAEELANDIIPNTVQNVM